MTETPEASSKSTIGTADPQRPSRLAQVAALVGIIAGVVFVVGVIFSRDFSWAQKWSSTEDRR
jgi:hypothetical protein